MDILGWLWWLVTTLLGVGFGLVWFLVGGWVSTLAQVAVVALMVFGYKFGWRRAPQEILARTGSVGRFLWGWVRARETGGATPARVEVQEREVVRRVTVREWGDVNLSTLLNILMLAGLTAKLLL